MNESIAVVPTFNESENIGHLLDSIFGLSEPVDVLVVDDGSPDGTAEIVREYQQRYGSRLHLIERGEKLGLGTAYLEGFRKVLGLGYTFVCQIDADLSHSPKDLPRLISAVRNKEGDVAVGSRYIEGVRVINWPLRRLFLSYGASVYTRAITRMPVKDATAGFKCFHRPVLEAIDFSKVHSNGYSFQIEMNYRAWKLGFAIKEIPIIFTERTEGQSKMSRAIVREAFLKVWELPLRSLFGRL